MRKAFTPFWDRAEELGMKVVLRTDMLTLTTPLEQYLTEHVGSLDTTSPDLWAVYTAGLDELYGAAPRSTACSCGSARRGASTTSPAGTTTPPSP